MKVTPQDVVAILSIGGGIATFYFLVNPETLVEMYYSIISLFW